VRHAQHLSALAELAQLPADDFGHRAADAGIDLVEHHAERRGLGGGGHLHARLMRDSSPPEATLARLLGGCPGLALTRNSISSLPCAPNSASLGVTLTANCRRHAERLHQSGDLLAEVGRRVLARLASARRGGSIFARSARACVRELRGSDLGVPRAPRVPARGARAAAGSSGRSAAVLARQRLERRGAALDLLLARRIDVERLEIAAQRIGGLARLDRGLGEQRADLRELGVGVGGAAQRRSAPWPEGRARCRRRRRRRRRSSAVRAASASRPRPAMRLRSSEQLLDVRDVVTSALSSPSW
jgi:hypothetical protein